VEPASNDRLFLLVFTKEDPMRALWLPLTLLLASSARAAEKTVLIPLHHVQASMFERYLMPGEERSAFPGGVVRGQSHSLVPDEITAWTIDARRNALSVTGSEDGIADLKRIIELIDVPTGRVRLSVKVVRLDPQDMNHLNTERLPPLLPGGEPTDFVAALTEPQAASFGSREALAAAELTVASNFPLHFAWPGNANQRSQPTEVLPRVNGDGTVTLYSPRSGPSPAGTPLAGEMIVARRIIPGHGVLIYSHGLGTALVVKVREILPADAKE
jgi:hypothetical protein